MIAKDSSRITPVAGRYLPIAAILAATLLLGPFARTPRAQGVAQQGQWTTLGYTMPINPVHIALLNNGKVLIVSGSGNVAAETNFRAAVWDPGSGSFAITEHMPWDMFCNAMVTLPDGRVLINGGTIKYDAFWGQQRSAVFDPNSGVFTDVENMAHGRWYPTSTVLGDGSVLTFSGTNETGSGTNLTVEIYTPGSATGWSTQSSALWTPPLYPRLHLLPDGTVFYSGSGRGSRIYDPSAKTWSAVKATMKYANSRTYGTSVLLPLSPADNYRARVMTFGGSNPATATTEIIEPLAATPSWQFGPNMSQARIEMNATILPNGRILAVGGSVNDEDTATASLTADLFDPATNQMIKFGQNNELPGAGSSAFPRLYHSGSLLLPDGRVALVGGNPARGSYQAQIEIYSPAYLFNANGTAATRPTISGLGSTEIGFGSTFQVFTPDASSISSVVLMRPGAATHSFDMEQRMIRLNFTAGATALDVTAPPNGNIAPPGYYMVFVLNSAGVPSTARFVHLTAAAAGPDLTVAKTHSGTFTQGQVGATYTVSVSNTGTGPTSGAVTVADSLPAGLSATAITGTGWSCTLATVSCTRSDALAAGASYPAITLTVTVAGNAPASVTNTATVSGGGDNTPGNNSVNDVTTIVSSTGTVPITLVQHTGKDAGTTSSSTLAFAAANTTGNWIGVIIRAGQTGQVFTVSDTRNNTYRRAVQYNETVDGTSLAIYYAENIAGGANTVSVSDNLGGTLRLAIAEYTGVALTNSFDVARGAQGTGTAMSSGSMTTTANSDLILGLLSTADAATFTAGAGFVIQERVPAAPNSKLAVEDRIQSAAGAIAATGTASVSNNWGAVAAAFRAAAAGPPPPADLTITKSHVGSFTRGQTGANYAVTVTNSGGGPTNAAVTATDTIPTGLTATAISGTGWTCTLGTVSCTRSDVLAAGASYPTITVTVSVAANAPSPVTNSVAVSGGGETNTANNSASDPTTVVAAGTPDLTVAKTHSGNFTQGQVGATYTLTVTNAGNAPTTAAVSLTDTLPTGLTATAITGTGWTCTLATVSCTRGDALPASSSYPTVTLTVSVAANAPSTVTNSVAVSGGGETNTANNSASDPTTVVAAGTPDLTVAKTHSGNFTQGQVGATYTLTVTNSGTAPTTAAVSLTDTLPTGLTATAISGTGWTCTLATVNCTRSNALAAGASYPAITLTVTVAGNAPSSVTNTVTVSGGGDDTPGNDTATDPTTITPSTGTVPITPAQHAGKDAGTTSSSTLAFPAANTAGNWIGVIIRAAQTGQVFTVSDTRNNTYRRAVQYNETVDRTTLAIFYAENIAGGANTVTVSDSLGGTLRFAIVEYAGVALTNSLDVTTAAQGTGTAMSSGTMTTTANNDLVLGLLSTADAATFTAGAGFVIQERVPAAPNSKLAVEDRIQPTAGAIAATGTASVSNNWGAVAAAFRAAAAPPSP